MAKKTATNDGISQARDLAKMLVQAGQEMLQAGKCMKQMVQHLQEANKLIGSIDDVSDLEELETTMAVQLEDQMQATNIAYQPREPLN